MSLRDRLRPLQVHFYFVVLVVIIIRVVHDDLFGDQLVHLVEVEDHLPSGDLLLQPLVFQSRDLRLQLFQLFFLLELLALVRGLLLLVKVRHPKQSRYSRTDEDGSFVGFQLRNNVSFAHIYFLTRLASLL